MKEGTVKLEEIIAKRLEGEKDPFYFADEDAIWCVEELKNSSSTTCGLVFVCSVWSVYGNNGYRYGEKEEFIFTNEGKCCFYDFDHEKQATVDRAKIIVKQMASAKWIDEEK